MNNAAKDKVRRKTEKRKISVVRGFWLLLWKGNFMKKVYLLLFIGLLSIRGFSQSVIPSTVGEVYNFAVGDTFIYSNGYPQQFWGFTQMQIIISRVDYPIGDSLKYVKRVITKTPMQTITEDTISQFLPQVDSSVLKGVLYLGMCGQSSIDSCWGTDTCYLGSAQFPTRKINIENSHCSPSGVLDGTYVEGIGVFSSSIDCFDSWNQSEFHFISELIYFHKNNGEVWGTPVNFSLGILEQKNSFTSVFISPNPCTTSFTIQLSEQPVSETYFQLYDALGRQVKREELNAITTTINRNNLPGGIYFWQLMQGNKMVERGKLVFE